MKSSERDQVEGKFHQAKGNLKKIAAKITDNPKLAVKGSAEKVIGKVQLELTADIKKTEDVKVLLQVASSGRAKEMTFNSSEDLKKGDKIKITAEKV